MRMYLQWCGIMSTNLVDYKFKLPDRFTIDIGNSFVQAVNDLNLKWEIGPNTLSARDATVYGYLNKDTKMTIKLTADAFEDALNVATAMLASGQRCVTINTLKRFDVVEWAELDYYEITCEYSGDKQLAMKAIRDKSDF